MDTQSTYESSELDREHLEALELQNELYRRAQVILEVDRQQSVSVFENAPVGFFVLDPSGAIQRVNKRGALVLGFAADELVDKDFQQFVCDPSAALFAEHLAVGSGDHRSATSDLLLCRENGDSFWARTRSEIAPGAGPGEESIIVTIDEIDDLMLDIRSQIEVSSQETSLEPSVPECLGGCIMLVDDDELILNSVSRVLRRLGYDIVSYADPTAALEAFGDNPDVFDAVISDFQMPRMNGLELCERIAARRADVPILLTSAFVGEIDHVRAKDVGVEYVMAKPLSADELRFWLNDVMPELPEPR